MRYVVVRSTWREDTESFLIKLTMGCKLSSNRDHDTKAPAIRRGSSQPGPMTKQQIEKRINSINETCVATFGGVSVRYAWLSQRGYYPDRE